VSGVKMDTWNMSCAEVDSTSCLRNDLMHRNCIWNALFTWGEKWLKGRAGNMWWMLSGSVGISRNNRNPTAEALSSLHLARKNIYSPHRDPLHWLSGGAWMVMRCWQWELCRR
jgi:hypothetical protein